MPRSARLWKCALVFYSARPGSESGTVEKQWGELALASCMQEPQSLLKSIHEPRFVCWILHSSIGHIPPSINRLVARSSVHTRTSSIRGVLLSLRDLVWPTSLPSPLFPAWLVPVPQPPTSGERIQQIYTASMYSSDNIKSNLLTRMSTSTCSLLCVEQARLANRRCLHEASETRRRARLQDCIGKSRTV